MPRIQQNPGAISFVFHYCSFQNHLPLYDVDIGFVVTPKAAQRDNFGPRGLPSVWSCPTVITSTGTGARFTRQGWAAACASQRFYYVYTGIAALAATVMHKCMGCNFRSPFRSSTKKNSSVFLLAVETWRQAWSKGVTMCCHQLCVLISSFWQLFQQLRLGFFALMTLTPNIVCQLYDEVQKERRRGPHSMGTLICYVTISLFASFFCFQICQTRLFSTLRIYLKDSKQNKIKVGTLVFLYLTNGIVGSKVSNNSIYVSRHF